MSFKMEGVIVPILTPFDAAGELNPVAVKQLVDYLIERGVHGLFPAGTTGEGALLTMSERQRLGEAVVDAAAGRVPVIIHAGATTTRATQELVHHAQSIGAQAVAVIPPFFYRHRDEALLAHYVAVANSAPDFPIYLYNFPAVSNNAFTFDLVMAIRAQAPNVIGSVLAFAQLLAVPSALLAPALVHRWGKERIILWGTFGVTVSLLPMAFIADWRAIAVGMLGILILTSVSRGPLTILMQEVVEPQWRPLVSGATTMTFGLSWFTTALSGGYIIAAFGYRELFLFGALLNVAGGFLLWGFLTAHQRRQSS